MTSNAPITGRQFPALRGQAVEDTGTPCPLCAAEGRQNVSGETPALRRIPGDSRLFCIGLHGYITSEETA